jgi:hypothetical protein
VLPVTRWARVDTWSVGRAAWVRSRYAAVCSALMLVAALFIPLRGTTVTQRLLAAGITADCCHRVVLGPSRPRSS